MAFATGKAHDVHSSASLESGTLSLQASGSIISAPAHQESQDMASIRESVTEDKDEIA